MGGLDFKAMHNYLLAIEVHEALKVPYQQEVVLAS